MKWRRAAVPAAMTLAAIVFVALLDYIGGHGVEKIDQAIDGRPADVADGWSVPDVDALPDDPWGKAVRLGRDLTVHTASLIGPEASDPAMRFAGSALQCSDCHLKAATQRFAMPFVGVYANYPQYSAREGRVITIEDRINGCMTRSVNGRPLPLDSEPMRAFIAYIKFLSEGRPVGVRADGLGVTPLPLLTRAADPHAGQAVFQRMCALCHGPDGLGRRAGPASERVGYEFPPIAGPASFNDGAGLARLIGAAEFIRGHMPAGATPEEPSLGVDEAWDVAAYVVSLDRPQRADLAADYPVRYQKPADTPYGPYVDGFSELQHKYGPFQPIEAKLKELAAAAK